MSERAQALAALQAIASSPDAVAESQAHLFASIDALVYVYRSHAPPNQTPLQAAMRSERAAWSAVLAHAEHRVQQLKAAEPPKANSK